MPYRYNPRLLTPPDDTVIWRYMDFARFVQFLSTKTLWFARSDTFEDPLEGTFTDAELDQKKSDLALLAANEANSNGVIDLELAKRGEFASLSVRALNATRQSTFVNCWRLGGSESLAMWDLYGKGSGTVAIKSTVGAFRRELDAQQEQVFISKVSYLSWSKTDSQDNFLYLCTRKDSSYEHESEVRAIIWPMDLMQKILEALSSKQPIPEIPNGKAVKVEPMRLVSEVVIGPREKCWVFDVVTNVLEMYGCEVPVTTSNRLRQRDISVFRP